MENTNICPEDIPCVGEKEMPSALEMAKNLMSDGAKIIKNAMEGNPSLADDETRAFRWSTCQSCEFFASERCTKCGCFMKVKTAFITSRCPIGKW